MRPTDPEHRRLADVVKLGLAAAFAVLAFGIGRPARQAPAGHPSNPQDGIRQMSQTTLQPDAGHGDSDRAPGDEHTGGEEPGTGQLGYAIGLGFALVLTLLAFGLLRTGLVWGPSIPIAISVLAIAQMGVHLVFFLHIGSAPDSTNNIMALAFGVMIVFLLVLGSMWIMGHLNHNMMPMDRIMNMQR